MNSRAFYRLAKWPPQVLYALGLGPLIGRLVLLLTTTGRKSGLPRVTPLQYEEVDGAFYVGAARGEKTDWFRNILADPHVEVRLGSRRFRGSAEPITDPNRIADFLQLRLRRHPKMVGTILRLEGLSRQPDRADLKRYAARLVLVVIRPEEPLAQTRPGVMGFARPLLKAVLGVMAIVVGWLLFVQTVVRLVRRFFHFPVPAFVARFIDNPFRRRLQPPAQVVDWVDIHAGMRVLEIGPGPGTFTVEAARRVGPGGKLFALDIQPAIVARLLNRLEREDVTNVVPEVASADLLPFADASFDRLFLVTVLAEFPDKVRALREFARVLKHDGVLAVGELVLDPDYPRRKTVIKWCRDAGFEPVDDHGNVLHYVLTFRRFSSQEHP